MPHTRRSIGFAGPFFVALTALMAIGGYLAYVQQPPAQAASVAQSGDDQEPGNNPAKPGQPDADPPPANGAKPEDPKADDPKPGDPQPAEPKSRAKPEGILPDYYPEVVSEEQRKKIYRIQKKYGEQLQRLADEMAGLKAAMNVEIESVLQPEQLAKVKKLQAEAAARQKAKERAAEDPAPAPNDRQAPPRDEPRDEPRGDLPRNDAPRDERRADADAAPNATPDAAAGAANPPPVKKRVRKN